MGEHCSMGKGGRASRGQHGCAMHLPNEGPATTVRPRVSHRVNHGAVPGIPRDH